MKYVFILFMLCGMLVFPADTEKKLVVKELVPETRKETVEEPKGKRDPFWDLLKRKKPLVETLEHLRIDEVKLSGIVKMSDGKFMALFVSNKNKPFIASVGQKLYDGKLVKITQNRVTFEKLPLVALPGKK